MSKQKPQTINIKIESIKNHIGSFKYHNDDWGTIAFMLPREQLHRKFTEPEFLYNGIYFLFGYEDSKEVVYVGQAKKRNSGESVISRLKEHADSLTEKYRDKWNCAILVTNKNDSWGLDDLNALEYAFYKLCKVYRKSLTCKRYGGNIIIERYCR